MVHPVEIIQTTVAAHFGLTREQLLAPTHQRAVARPRQIAIFFCRELTNRSLPDLAKRFRGKHHTTILWGRHRIEKLIPIDVDVANAVAVLRPVLQAQLTGERRPADDVRDLAGLIGDWRTRDPRRIDRGWLRDAEAALLSGKPAPIAEALAALRAFDAALAAQLAARAAAIAERVNG